MPHATSGWPAVVDPECAIEPGVVQPPVDQSSVDVVAVCGGANAPSSATTAARSGDAGSTAIAGLCWALGLFESAAVSGESHATPSAGAEMSSTAAAPTTSTSA